MTEDEERRAYYDMLVEYYYGYAKQGITAPVRDNDVLMLDARREAFARLVPSPTAAAAAPSPARAPLRGPLPAPPVTASAPTPVIEEAAVPTFSFSTDDDDGSHDVVEQQHDKALYKPIQQDTVPTCAGCHALLFGKAVIAYDQHWHSDCFVCAHEDCNERLEFVEFRRSPDDVAPEDERLRDKVWCMVHFEEHFGPKCHHCKTPISDSAFLSIDDDALTPPQRTYHALHFFCSSCGDPFVDPTSLERGKETTLAEPYVVSGGWCYCARCDLRLRGPKCARCRKAIEEWVEWDGDKVCKECWKCEGCGRRLDESFLVKTLDDGYEQVLCNACHD